MTNLRERRTKCILESDDAVREAGQYRNVIIECHPTHMTVKLKRMRKSYDIPYSAVWSMAVKADIERVRKEKLKARKTK